MSNLAHARKLSVLFVTLLAIGVGCGKDDQSVGDFQPIAPGHTVQINSPADDPTASNVQRRDPEGIRIRNKSQEALEAAGFHFASNLPTRGHRAAVSGKLRPMRDVALRLMALEVLFTWVAMPDSEVSTDSLNKHIAKNNLNAYMTDQEKLVIQLSRSEANQKHVGSVGWHLENMWALAWILGFDPQPDATSGQIVGEISRAIVLEFVPKHGTSVDEFLTHIKPRTQQEVVELEDLFYCAHNAVRSAQTGSKTSVPETFHPVIDGGAIHERRHSLTWALSPGVEWAHTDLST